MTKEEFIKQCLLDALSALDVPDLPKIVTIRENDYIYPHVAVERIKSVLDVDKFFPKK